MLEVVMKYLAKLFVSQHGKQEQKFTFNLEALDDYLHNQLTTHLNPLILD